MTRWEKAKADWHGVQGKRELLVASVGAIVSAVVLLVAGFPHDAAVIGVSILGSALALAVLVPAAELYWSWLQAPARLLMDEVYAIRERVDQLDCGVGNAPRTQLGLRHALMDHKRVGDELVAEAANYGFKPSDADARVWTNAVIAFLGARMANGLDEFMTAGIGSSSDRISERISALSRMLEQLDAEAGEGPSDAKATARVWCSEMRAGSWSRYGRPASATCR